MLTEAVNWRCKLLMSLVMLACFHHCDTSLPTSGLYDRLLQKPPLDRAKRLDGRICLTSTKSSYMQVSCMQGEQSWNRVLPEETSVVETTSLPSDPRLLPEVGNGHVATVIGSDTIFMNGLYNGANISSHRARIPSTAAIFINITSPQTGWKRKYRMDFGLGVFSEIYTADDFTVQLNRYAHRELTRLLVTEVVVNRTDKARPVTITFTVNTGDDSQDIDFHQEGQGMKSGTTRVAEYPDVIGVTPVTVVYSEVLPNMTFDSIGQAYMPFFTAISSIRAEAIDSVNKGMERMMQGTLFSSHVNAWQNVWQEGHIDLTGNVSMATMTNAALYYLLSSVPLKPDDTWPFVGLTTGGLAHGSANEDYQGHVFWDQETWMFPPLALLHIDVGQIILGSRLRTHAAALKYAHITGFKGARYPWESAFTGLEVSPWEMSARYEIHVTGDVAWMMRQYLQLTNDTHFLSQDGGYQVFVDIANYWLSRLVSFNDTGKYGIQDDMGPDEFNYPVNNSAYVNAIAALSLYSASYAAFLLNQTAPPQWDQVASAVYIPFDAERKFHPEFDNYKLGTIVKQADAILLGFPLKWPNITDEVRKNDLNYYATVTDPEGPAMSWSMFCINWLRVGNMTKAQETFFKATYSMKDPFKVWSERANGSGAYNFHTGMGGYLQSLLYGYAGFDLSDQHLGLNPQLPPSITFVTITGVDYAGNSLDVKYDVQQMNVTVTKGINSLVLVLMVDERLQKLEVGVTVTARCQAALVLRPDMAEKLLMSQGW